MLKINILLILVISAFSLKAQTGTENYRPIPFMPAYLMKNDTMYMYFVYEKSEKIDSVKLRDIYVRIPEKKNVWTCNSTTSICEYKFKKKKTSDWFVKNNPIYFNADEEYRVSYLKEVNLKTGETRIVRSTKWFVRQRIVKPKKKAEGK